MEKIALLHAEDVVFFNEVRTMMFKVAKEYSLPLASVEPLPMPKSAMSDRLGDCNTTGHIRLVMRCTVDGEFVDHPLSPANVLGHGGT